MFAPAYMGRRAQPTNANLFGRHTNPGRRWFYISNSPQKRHPERSASPTYRVTQRLWRGVRRACPERSRGNPGDAWRPLPLGDFQSPKLAPCGLATVVPCVTRPLYFEGSEDRPGLLSAVLAGLNLERDVLTQYLQPYVMFGMNPA